MNGIGRRGFRESRFPVYRNLMKKKMMISYENASLSHLF